MSHPPHLIVIALAAVASAADPPGPRFRFSFDDGSASASDDINPLFSGVVENYATTAGPDGTTAILNDPTSSDSSDQTYVVWDESTSLAMLPVAAAPRTVCLRARVDVFDGGALFHYGDPIVNGGSFILKTQAEDGKMKLKLGGNRDLDDVAVNGDGAWHHYCAAYDAAARASLYEDGVLLQSEEVELDTASAYLRGAVDDLRIYDVALDAAGVAAVAADVLAPDPPPLVAHYSFDDGTATEDSDSSLDGTITGATATTGLFGSGALSFDGSNDYVEFPSAVTSDILGSSARTVCLWAVINSFGGDGGLFDYGAYSDQANFALRVHGTSASLYVELWGGDTGVALSGSDDGGWHHYCLTYDGSGWVLYFDGSQAATATAALDTGSDRPLQIGRFDSDYYLDGSIDEVYVYASALDEASIQVLYDAGSTAAPTAAPTTAPTTALLAAGVRYSFDAVAGASVPEASGEPALAGTIVGEHALAVGVDGGGAVDLSGGHVEFPAEVTSGVLGSAPRTLCLWALRRGGGALASYGGDDDGPTGSAFGLGFTGTRSRPGSG
ncbi:glutathione transferase [Aureococcus anophagefferens]|nr:glutathione transferase [Aureococcus anophagefferens]